MAHQITDTDHMFSRGETPWHSLGTVLAADANPTSFEAQTLAKLDWTVSLVPLQTVPNGHASQTVDTHAAVRRDDTGALFGVVGSKFPLFQNTDGFDTFEPWRQEGAISYETSGSLRGGAKVWILARLAIRDLEIGGRDKVAPYLLLSWGNDGTLAIRALATGVRVVCANTLAMALGRGGAGVRIVHRGDVVGKATAAVGLLDGLRVAAERRAEQWRKQAATAASDLDVARYVAAVFQRPIAEVIGEGKDPKTGETRKPIRALAPIVDAWDNPRGGQLATTEGTAWGLNQAISEYLTHGSEGSRRDAESRLDSAAFGDGRARLDRAEVVADVLASIGIRKSSGLTWEDVIAAPTERLRAMVEIARAA